MGSDRLIVGSVTREKHAVIQLTLLDSEGQPQRVEAMIDTGYNGALSLAPELVERLGYGWIGDGQSVLADGSIASFDVYRGKVWWFGQARAVSVDAMDCPPTIGMSLLTHHLLTILVAPGGEVTIKRF